MGISWQHTLKKEVKYQGIGLHQGEEVAITCLPAPPDTGILFLVKDGNREVQIKANLANVVSTERCTTLGSQGVTLSTVEHLLAALKGLEIDNAYIKVRGNEIPIGDGSAQVYARLFFEAQREVQEVERTIWKIKEAFWVKRGSMVMLLLPAHTSFISYTLVLDHPLVKVQFVEFPLTRESFLQEIAKARTFGFSREVRALQERGLIKGANLSNAILIGEEEIFGELRFPDELARHKILDIIGDMALTTPFLGHMVALRSGHTLHVELARKVERFFQNKALI